MAQQVFTNRYRIDGPVARGGMAEVFRARDLLLDRPVALKVLSPELSADPSFVERFRREAQAAANLNHPNIVSIYDWGEEGDTYFIVMEFVEGRTLRDIVRAEGPLHPDRAADIAADIAAALGFAHRNGVIHRDVKPGNVLITPTGQVKVTDFGIARAVRENVQDDLTRTGTVMGTATYFSPEQAQGLPIDQRSDVYSLGIVLYEMATGRPPFTGENPVTIALQHVKEDPTRPSRLNPDVPPPLEAIMGKALAKHPAARYSSADELRADLLRFRDGRAVSAQPATVSPLPPADSTRVQPAYQDGTRTMGATSMSAGGPPPVVAGPLPRRRTGAYIALLLVLLAILAVLLFVLARQFGIGGGGGSGRVEVPVVAGKDVLTATKLLQDRGLKAKNETVSNETVQENTVFGSDPAAGDRVKKGSTVTLKVSSGAPDLPVPNVVGSNVEDASNLLRQTGFQVTVQQRASDTEPKGKVLDQDPKADAKAKRGTAVTLVVSSGLPQVAVPDVAGKDPTDAAAELGQRQFRIARRSEPSATVEADKVIGTEPPAGSQAPKGSVITLIISSGPPDVTVPPVLDKTPADARAVLEQAGFQVETRSMEVTDETQDGFVVKQIPVSGTAARSGSTVTIFVGQFTATTSSTTTSSTTTTP